MQSCRKRGKRLREVLDPGCVGVTFQLWDLGGKAQHADKIRTAGNRRDLLKSFREEGGTVPWSTGSGVFFPRIFVFKVIVGCRFCLWEAMLLQIHPIT